MSRTRNDGALILTSKIRDGEQNSMVIRQIENKRKKGGSCPDLGLIN